MWHLDTYEGFKQFAASFTDVDRLRYDLLGDVAQALEIEHVTELDI